MARRRVRPGMVRWLSGLLASVLLVAAVSGLTVLFQRWLLPLRVLYILAVVPVAIIWGTRLAVLTAVLSAAAYDFLFIPPIHTFRIADPRNSVALGAFVVTAVAVGGLTGRLRRAAMESGRLSKEQAALRRVATLVAQRTPPPEVFSAVARELAEEFAATVTAVLRYEDDGTATVVGGWGEPGTQIPIGTRRKVVGQGVAVSVRQTGAAVRTERFDGPAGSAARFFQEAGAITGTGSPIMVEGGLWGVAIVASRNANAFPAGTETRIAEFTELIASAIANAQARMELRGYADEQAALRRVATLLAGATPPEELFFAVTEQVGQLLCVDLTVLGRYGHGTETLIAAWSKSGTFGALGEPLQLGGNNVATLVFETGRTARIDDYPEATGESAVAARAWGLRGCVGVPVNVEGRLWGVMYAASTTAAPLPADIEPRLAQFTELVATAIANAKARAELIASRARIVATADETRRSIERDLHDGAQQRLVSLALQLRAAQAAVPPELGQLGADLERVTAGLINAQEELREYARGIHPAILTESGLGSALKKLGRRCPIPVDLDIKADGRLPEPIEVAAYYVVSEALTNAVKHANAANAAVEVEAVTGTLRISVRDDGGGGACFTGGTGLVGLKDRVEALGGRIWLHSPHGAGTTLRAELPFTNTDAVDRRDSPPGGLTGTT
jgi:signal transduction histidine kinase